MPLLTPVKADFGEQGNQDLDKFVYENLTALLAAYSDLHKTKVPEWRRLTKGQPKDKSRNFPWPGASNVVIQLIGENVETIKAVQLGTIYEILPLWVVGLVGDWAKQEFGSEQQMAWQAFLDYVGISRDELDLYRIESKAAHDIAALGSVVVKLPWTTCMETVVTGLDTNGKRVETEEEMYDGPRPEKLAYEDWGATPTAQTWEEANFKYHVYRLTMQECEYKVHKGHFDKNAWEKVKQGGPDHEGLTDEERQKMAEQNINEGTPNKEMARWCFYECWFKYIQGEKVYRIIHTYHLKQKQRMNAIFNFYPKNEEPFEFGRLGYSEDGLIGYGFAEMGEMYQEDVSTKHNQRNDAGTLANTSIILGGNNPRVDSGITLFPGAVLPFSPDDVAIERMGAPPLPTVDEEQLTIALAKARFGTDMMSPEGMGSGTVNKKGGYSSMGTFSIMQQGARRINVNITDFRYLHLNIGQKVSKQYAFFGVGDKRLKYFGDKARFLQMAAQSIRAGRIVLPIRAATASINREIEKQTGMLFTQVMQRHFGAVAQALQGVSSPNPMVTPEMKKYLLGSIDAMSFIMTKLLRAFGYDDLTRLQPEQEIVRQLEEGNKGANNGQQRMGSPASQNAGTNGESGGQETEGAPGNSNDASLASTAQSSGGILIS